MTLRVMNTNARNVMDRFTQSKEDPLGEIRSQGEADQCSWMKDSFDGVKWAANEGSIRNI